MKTRKENYLRCVDMTHNLKEKLCGFRFQNEMFREDWGSLFSLFLKIKDRRDKSPKNGKLRKELSDKEMHDLLVVLAHVSEHEQKWGTLRASALCEAYEKRGCESGKHALDWAFAPDHVIDGRDPWNN